MWTKFKNSNFKNYLFTQSIVGSSYYLVSTFTYVKPVELPLTFIDISVKPHFSAFWIYMSFFFLLICGITFVSKEDSKECVKNVLMNSLIASFFFFFFPTRITFDDYTPYVQEDTITGDFIKMMKQYDNTSNCFPSLHISNSITATYFLNKYKKQSTKIINIIWLILIVWSVLSTKQHTIYDVIGGLLLSLTSFKVIDYLNKTYLQKKIIG